MDIDVSRSLNGRQMDVNVSLLCEVKTDGLQCSSLSEVKKDGGQCFLAVLRKGRWTSVFSRSLNYSRDRWTSVFLSVCSTVKTDGL